MYIRYIALFKIAYSFKVRAEATEPFAMFMSNQEPGPLEEEAVQALRDILGTDEYNDGNYSISITFTDSY